MIGESDASIITKIKSGDIFAFEVLVKKYQKRVLGFLSRYIYDSNDREDLTQEIFFKLYQNIDKINTDKSFTAFLFTIARNKAISHLRTRKANVSLDFAEDLNEDADIYTNLERSDLSGEIKGLINELPEKYRSVILKYYFEDLSYEEISRNLNIPINSVRTLLKRAKDKLRKVIYE